jgi:hypothetical protein
MGVFFALTAALSLGVHFFQTLAFQKAELKVLQPFKFLRLIFVLILQSVVDVFHFDVYVIVGALLIFLSSIIPFYLENFFKRKKLDVPS